MHSCCVDKCVYVHKLLQKTFCTIGVSKWDPQGTAREQLQAARRDLMEITSTISKSCQEVLEKLDRSKVITHHTIKLKLVCTERRRPQIN